MDEDGHVAFICFPLVTFEATVEERRSAGGLWDGLFPACWDNQAGDSPSSPVSNPHSVRAPVTSRGLLTSDALQVTCLGGGPDGGGWSRGTHSTAEAAE